MTGAGIVTALGLDWATNASAFQEGRTAFRTVSLFDVSRQRVKAAAEVDLPADLPQTRLRARRVNRMDRAARLLLIAGEEAWRGSGWQPSEFIPTVLGTTSGGMTLGQAYLRQCIEAPAKHTQQAQRVTHYQAQRQALDLQDAFGFAGPVVVIANACASGANAVGHAFDLVRQRQAERVLCGGYDALSQLVFSGFDSLQALSPTVCRPFDVRRDGLALGEGAAVFALESLESAERRKATVLGEVAGYGAAMDVHHLTQPHPEGAAALESMTAACVRAGVEPAQIGYINAHGTGTVLNDSAETAAINHWAGASAPRISVSSTKGGIGHLLGAAGAVEVAVCVMALRGQWLPPTARLREPDPAAQFSLVREPTRASFEYALTNSFGFGGANATLVLRRWT
ncbi:MAG: beta-ketoacyl synthase [Verrucomicrobiia bacterium]